MARLLRQHTPLLLFEVIHLATSILPVVKRSKIQVWFSLKLTSFRFKIPCRKMTILRTGVTIRNYVNLGLPTAVEILQRALARANKMKKQKPQSTSRHS